ncbi:MAG TPA: D-xylose transporter XylE [Bacteroidales bacterium]|nr:D-xylose transporter XylE [Bacteroidales bacterium]
MEANPDNGRKGYVRSLTMVATLGGLLFGYDTAVISGAVGALEAFFIKGLAYDTEMAASVIREFRISVALVVIGIGLAVSAIFFKLFRKGIALICSAGLISILILVLGLAFWNQPPVFTEAIASSIKGFTIASALVGCIIGGAIAGYVSQSLGRRDGLKLAALLFLVSAIGSASPERLNFMGFEVINSFIIFRIIGGIGVGIASMLSPMYIAEIAPASIRGKLVSWNQFAIIFGMLVVYFVNYFIARLGDDQWLIQYGWRWMFASEIIPAALFLLLLFFVPETPRFLVMKNRPDKAWDILLRLGGKKQALVIIEEIKESLRQKDAHWLSYGGLVIVIGILISVFQQFVGINVVLYYAPEIFRKMGAATDVSLLQTIIVGAVNLSFTVVAIATVDKFGRKPLMIIGALGMALSMFALGTAFFTGQMGYAALFFMLLYTASFAVSWGPVAWVLLSEIFPNQIRGAMAIAVAAQWIANLTISWTFPILNDHPVLVAMFNHGLSYWIYGLMGLLAALFVWKVVPETKGKTLEEMDGLWKKKKP